MILILTLTLFPPKSLFLGSQEIQIPTIGNRLNLSRDSGEDGFDSIENDRFEFGLDARETAGTDCTFRPVL